MITYVVYPDNRPLPAYGTLAALFYKPPVAVISRGRKVSPLGADAEARDYKKQGRKQKAENMAQRRVNNDAARVKIYRPAMIGSGWMSSREIAEKTDDAVRQQMKQLMKSGDVESQRMQNSTRLYRWVCK